MLRLETTKGCPATPRVLFALEETGTLYELDYKDDGYFAQTHGMPGPLLVDDDFQLLEAAAIVRYIARTRGEGVLMPSDPRGQAQVDRWIDFALFRLAMAFVRNDMQMAVGHVELLEGALDGREWICGTFSAADCMLTMLASMTHRLSLDPFPRVRAYLARLTARPAWLRVRARTTDMH